MLTHCRSYTLSAEMDDMIELLRLNSSVTVHTCILKRSTHMDFFHEEMASVTGQAKSAGRIVSHTLGKSFAMPDAKYVFNQVFQGGGAPSVAPGMLQDDRVFSVSRQ